MPTETLSLGRDRFEALLDRWPDVRANVLRIVYRRFARSLAHGPGSANAARPSPCSPGLAAAADALVEAAKAASLQPVAALDTRTGFEAAVAHLEDLLPDHGTVLVIAAPRSARAAPVPARGPSRGDRGKAGGGRCPPRDPQMWSSSSS